MQRVDVAVRFCQFKFKLLTTNTTHRMETLLYNDPTLDNNIDRAIYVMFVTPATRKHERQSTTLRAAYLRISGYCNRDCVRLGSQ